MYKTIKMWILLLICFVSFGCVTPRNQENLSIEPSVQQPKPIGVYHKVSNGETLWRIAKIYNVSLNKLIELNNIPDVAQIEKNQLIFIPDATEVKEIAFESGSEDKEFVWPIKGKVVSYFHGRKGNSINKGIDIHAKEGEIVRAARTGKVVFADYLSGYGNTIILDHNDGFYSVYSQNSKLLVKLGELVFKNKEISQLGITNDLAFLHFEIRKDSIEDNPLYYLP